MKTVRECGLGIEELEELLMGLLRLHRPETPSELSTRPWGSCDSRNIPQAQDHWRSPWWQGGLGWIVARGAGFRPLQAATLKTKIRSCSIVTGYRDPPLADRCITRPVPTQCVGPFNTWARSMRRMAFAGWFGSHSADGTEDTSCNSAVVKRPLAKREP